MQLWASLLLFSNQAGSGTRKRDGRQLMISNIFEKSSCLNYQLVAARARTVGRTGDILNQKCLAVVALGRPITDGPFPGYTLCKYFLLVPQPHSVTLRGAARQCDSAADSCVDAQIGLPFGASGFDAETVSVITYRASHIDGELRLSKQLDV
eukprot:4250692-Pleurochrysis_carterae.AAC.1